MGQFLAGEVGQFQSGEITRSPARKSASATPRKQAPASVHDQVAPSDERTILRIRQKYRTSCGVAAAAMLARVSHEDALPVIFADDKDKPKRRVFYTHYTDVKQALEHFGVEHADRPIRVKAWEDIPTTSLVKVKWFENGKVGWHWVIFQRRDAAKWIVIDPDASSKDTLRLGKQALAGYTPVSYLAVSPVVPKGKSVR